jgi:hypothetical protein
MWAQACRAMWDAWDFGDGGNQQSTQQNDASGGDENNKTKTEIKGPTPYVSPKEKQDAFQQGMNESVLQGYCGLFSENNITIYVKGKDGTLYCVIISDASQVKTNSDGTTTVDWSNSLQNAYIDGKNAGGKLGQALAIATLLVSAGGEIGLEPNNFRAYRYVTNGEVNAIDETGILRGGRPGETFLTTDRYSSGSAAQSNLSLETTPTHRVKFEVINNPIFEKVNTKVAPAYNQPGGGTEIVTPNQVQVKVIYVKRLR